MTADLQPSAFARRVVPPHWLLLMALGEVALHRWLPLVHWIPAPWRWLGALPIAAGIAVGLWAFLLFRQRKTSPRPFAESTALVAEGPYRWTRNPMYLGMLLLLTGEAVLLGAATPFIVLPLFFGIITRLYILPEEAHMERAFGAAYLDFKRHARRWI